MINSEDGIYGFIVGDALGVPVEFNNRIILEQNPVKNMREFGTHGQPKGTWSDDTSMMLATIDSLIDKNGYSFGSSFYDIADKFVLWYKNNKYTPNNEVFDIGNTTRRALNNYLKNKNRLCGCGELSENGNGSLMRILPLAYYFYCSNLDIQQRKEIIFEVSSITHSNIISKYGCLIYTELALNFLNNSNNKDLISVYCEIVKTVSALIKKEDKKDKEIIKRYYSKILNRKICKERYENINSSGFIVDTLEAVIWVILNTQNYKEAVLKAVNLGDDTDTIGALVGGIAGIVYGSCSIPKEWIEDLQKKEYIDAMIKSFNECLEKIKYPTNFIDSEILQDTIEDLRNNPNAFALEDCNDTPKNTLMIPRCKPSKQLSKFMEYIYNNELMDKEYLENYEKIKDKEIKYMNYNEIITSLTFFLRGERFCGGFWYTNFKNGRILKILVRLKELEDGNRK